MDFIFLVIGGVIIRVVSAGGKTLLQDAHVKKIVLQLMHGTYTDIPFNRVNT